MRLFGRGPEAGNVEAVVEVRAEVIHPADGEEDVHSELWRSVSQYGLGCGRKILRVRGNSYLEHFEVTPL